MRGGSAKPPELQVFWTSQAEQDRKYWQRHDRQMLARIDRLVANLKNNPFAGIGKPEPLRHEWSGYWSRRITGEHRLVYRVEPGIVYIAQCRFQYD